MTQTRGSGIPEPWERPQLEALGQRLQDARMAGGLSRAQLARQLSVHRGTVRRIECGVMRTRPRRISNWLEIAGCLSELEPILADYASVLAPDGPVVRRHRLARFQPRWQHGQ